MERVYVGVDLHRDVVQLSVRNERGEIVDRQRFRGERKKEAVAFIASLLKASVAVEAVGFNRWFVSSTPTAWRTRRARSGPRQG